MKNIIDASDEQFLSEHTLDAALSREDEQDVIPEVQFDLAITPSDPTLELLCMKLDSGDMIVPFYQRKYVWSLEQASRLIESFLIGLPVPQVFFYVNNEDTLEIIDGQQRIMSIKYFFEGYFGTPDSSDRRKIFKLKGLSDTSSYNGKTFAELDKKDQRKLKNSTLRAINIRQLAPDTDNSCVFHIFQRLNTGGTQLKPQEIRNAVYRGNIVKKLYELNVNPNWLKILGFKSPHKNQRDVELILRLFGLYQNWSNYEKPMISFLNKTMSDNIAFDSEKALEFSKKFPNVCEIIIQNIERPFRPKGTINTAMLEAVFIALLEQKSYNESLFKDKYDLLLSNPDFVSAINGPTADNALLKMRIEKAISILSD